MGLALSSGIDIDDNKRTLCEIWTRVMGYHRPVSSWNKGKKSEFRDRKYFNVGGEDRLSRINKTGWNK